MCCIRKKRNKKKCSDSTTATLPLNTAHSGTNTNTMETTGGKNKKLLLGNRAGSTGKTSKPKVVDVHKKISSMEEHQKFSEKQMEEAMQILGCTTVNTTIIQRLEKASKEMGEKSQVSTRQGDIQFTLAKTNFRKPKKDDDTLYPLLHKQDGNNNSIINNGNNKTSTQDCEDKEIELLQENWDNEPNSENYMWNTREIRYTCVDMLRHLDKNVLIEATGDPCTDEDIDSKIEWDPYAPLNVLENRSVFDCHTLRKNTFLSTALCCSTKAEQKAAKTKPKISVPKKVKVIEPSIELTRLRAEYTAQTYCTANSDSLDRTVDTQETVEATPRSKR